MGVGDRLMKRIRGALPGNRPGLINRVQGALPRNRGGGGPDATSQALQMVGQRAAAGAFGAPGGQKMAQPGGPPQAAPPMAMGQGPKGMAPGAPPPMAPKPMAPMGGQMAAQPGMTPMGQGGGRRARKPLFG